MSAKRLIFISLFLGFTAGFIYGNAILRHWLPTTPEELLERVNSTGLDYIGQRHGSEALYEYHIKHSTDSRSWDQLFEDYSPGKSKGHVVILPTIPGKSVSGVRLGSLELHGDPEEINRIIQALR